MANADLTPEQYEMLFGERPPHVDQRRRIGQRIADFLRRHPVDSAIIGLLLVGGLVSLFLG